MWSEPLQSFEISAANGGLIQPYSLNDPMPPWEIKSMIALYGSGDQSDCVANLITSSPSVSQCGASRSKMTTPTFKSPASSIVPSVNVTWSGLPVFFPKMGLPHVGQNTFVTTDCWADVYSISRMAPETVTASAANIAPTECPAPLSLRHSLQ